MSISRSRSKSVRLSRSVKRKASRSLSTRSSGTSGIITRRGTSHSGNLPIIGKPLQISNKNEKIANSLACKLTLPIEVINDFKFQYEVDPAQQFMKSAATLYTANNIKDIFYYASKPDQSNMLNGTYMAPDLGSYVPFKVQCLGAEISLNFSNATNMDSVIDVYVCCSRRDVHEIYASDGNITDMFHLNDWITYEAFNQSPLDHTVDATIYKNPVYTDPRCSLFDRHGFLKDFKILKSNSFVLAGGESRSYLHTDSRHHVLDSHVHSYSSIKRNVALRNLTTFLVYRIRGGLVSDASSSAHQGVGPTKVNVVGSIKYVFKRIKIAQRQVVYEVSVLDTIAKANVRAFDPENNADVEEYKSI